MKVLLVLALLCAVAVAARVEKRQYFENSDFDFAEDKNVDKREYNVDDDDDDDDDDEEEEDEPDVGSYGYDADAKDLYKRSPPYLFKRQYADDEGYYEDDNSAKDLKKRDYDDDEEYGRYDDIRK